MEGAEEADIQLRFASGTHAPPAGCGFDGPGGVKAHAFYPPKGQVLQILSYLDVYALCKLESQDSVIIHPSSFPLTGSIGCTVQLLYPRT